MDEIFEFRIPEGWACEWLEPADGKSNGTKSVRIVSARRGSELYERVIRIQRARMEVDERLFLSWNVRRDYELEEIEAAELFVLKRSNLFEPAGEELGCVYLPHLDGPAEFDNRVGSLILKCSRFRGTSFSESIAGERLVAPELQTLTRTERFTGSRFGPVFCAGHETTKSDWAELIVTSRRIPICPPTLVGTDPLNFAVVASGDEVGNIGLNVLSEVFVDRSAWDGSDFVASQQTVGSHQGLLRPSRLLFVSKRLFRSLSPKMRRGLRFEIVRFSDLSPPRLARA